MKIRNYYFSKLEYNETENFIMPNEDQTGNIAIQYSPSFNSQIQVNKDNDPDVMAVLSVIQAEEENVPVSFAVTLKAELSFDSEDDMRNVNLMVNRLMAPLIRNAVAMLTSMSMDENPVFFPLDQLNLAMENADLN